MVKAAKNGRVAEPRKWLSLPYGAFLLIFVIFPILLIIYYSFSSSDGSITVDNYAAILGNITNWKVIGRSLLIGALNTVFCIAIGYPLAYILANSKFNKNRLLVYIFVLPMWINFVIRTAATKEMLEWIKIDSGDHALLATVIGMVYNYLPFAILPLYTTMLKLDKSQIEAAADLGANPFQVFTRTIVPMSMPGVVSAAMMTFMPTMSSYVIADKLGGGKTTLIGNLISGYFDQAMYNMGSVLSIVMLILIAASLFAERAVVGKKGGR